MVEITSEVNNSLIWDIDDKEYFNITLQEYKVI